MPKHKKLLVSVVAVIAALVSGGAALAAYTPMFSVASGATSTSITFKQSAADDPSAQLAVYVPANYAMDLGDIGFSVGKVTAVASAADLGGAPLTLTGEIKPGLSTDTIPFAGGSFTLGQLAQSCTGKATHDAFWVLNLSAAGQTLQVPVYVDRVDPTTPLGAFLWFKLTTCLPPPDVPAGTPGRAAFGAKVLGVTLTIDGMTAEVQGEHRWFFTATPYTAGTGQANAAGSVEEQSLDRTPATLTLTAKATAKQHVAAISGRLTAGGKGFPGATVTIYSGTKAIGHVRTKGNGTYSFKGRINGSVRLSATAVAPVTTAAATCSSLLGAPSCIGTTVGGFTAASTTVRFKD